MKSLTQLLLSLTGLVLLTCPLSHGQRFSLSGQLYPNHGLVLREDIGETNTSNLDPDNGLHCISFSGCCTSVPASQRGEFYFPGSTNLVPIMSNIGSGGYFRNRAADRIILNRRSPDGTTTGIFECRIRTDSSQTEYQIFYIGVYDAGAGSPTISGVTLSNDSRTLTCTSTGGPATFVVWRQNCIILQQNDANYVQNQVVTSTLTATYENTLEINNNTFTDGVYTCSVRNSRGYGSSSVGVGSDYSSPLPITVSITPPSTPMAGQSFTLTCQATTALTSPSYQWFDNSGGMVGNGSTLALNPLLESGSGEYSCQVTAGSGVNQRFGCGVTRVDVQAPSITVTVNNASNAVAGQRHSLSCSVTGSNLETATIMYTWRLSTTVLQGPSTSNMYNITMVQVGNAGDVYTCEVTVTASYWDVSGSFGDSGSGTLSVTIPTPTVQFTRLVLGSLYVGLPFSWRCEVEIPGNQLVGVTADVEWKGPSGVVITNNSRFTVGATVESSPGREYQKTLTFSPLSADEDSGSYSCSATVMPTVTSSFVTNGVGTGSDSLTVADTTLAVSLMRTSVPPRVLDLMNYNGFTLTCTATSRAVTMDVAVAKAITWMRSVDDGNPQVLTDVTNGEFVMISTTDLELATAMSTLEVNTTVAGSHVYTCNVNLSIMPAPDVIQEQDTTTIVVQGAVAPNSTVGLSASGITHESVTISWTVTSLSYGPETYVVQYGTDMNTLNETSSMVTSGSDITMTNFTLSISLTGLQMTTTYYYRVIAMNDVGGMTQSTTVGTFNTSGLASEPPRMLNGSASTNPAEPPSLTFNWLVPNVTNGDILYYSLTCMSEGIADPPSVTSNTTLATISNLENGLQYCCTVTARNAVEDSMPSEQQCISTIEIAPTGEPQGFMTRVTDSRNVTFTWLLPVLTERNGIITNYNLTCVSTTTGREAFLPRVYPVAESNSYTLSGLKPDTSYTCRVFAINSVGRGPTANLSLTTQPDEPDGPPQDITFTLVDDDPSQVEFNFNPPREDLQNGFIVEYRISCVDRDRTGDAVAMIYQSSLPRPYTLSNLVPATLYDCSLSARTSPGFGVNDTVEVLTMPAQIAMISIVPERRSLLVMWNYTNPLLSEGAVISGYRVYLDDQSIQELTSSSMNQFNVTSLSPFTNYTVAVSAFNTRGDGMKQEGPRIDPQPTRTLEDVPGAPMCASRFMSRSLTSVGVRWKSPNMENGIITAFYVEILTYSSEQVQQTSSLSDLTSLTLTLDGLSLGTGVPYDVRVFAENGAGNGSSCTFTDFAVEGTPPDIIYDSIKVNRTGDGSKANITWMVLSLEVVKGYVTFKIEYSSGTSSRKRQVEDAPVGCSMSGCPIPYEQGGVIVTGLDPEQQVSFTIQAENEAGVQGMTLTRTADSLSPTTNTPTQSGSPVVIIVVIVIVVVLVVIVIVVVILVVLVLRKKGETKRLYSPGHYNTSSPKHDIAMEERKLTDESRLSNRTPSPLSLEKPPSPVGSPTIHEGDRLQPIQIEYFGEHVKNMHENRDKRFEREYKGLPNDESIPATAAAQNKAKNRFANIHPYDFSRVKLSEVNGVDGSDYINASYIDGHNRTNAYIAAQGPMPNTVGDFWRMVWEHRLSTIVMLTKVTEGGKRKCETYWPENVHDTYTPPDTNLMVTFSEVQPFADYEIKKLVLTDTSDPASSPLSISHYHFLGWPDHGVPQFATSLIGFIRRVKGGYNKGGPPMLVHCSAGVGRTGTFIVLDTMLERMQTENTVNVYEFLRNMRAKRTQMVQTQAQYVFIHDALDELITCGDTSVSSHNLRIKLGNLGKIVPGKIITGFQHQFELLSEVSRKPTDKDCADALQHYNGSKNRYHDRLPFNTNRVRLRPTGVTGAEYINASFVDGYKKRHAYIASQAPLQGTVNDFWRMIWEFKSKCIVMLCNLMEQGQESSFPYWPTKVDQPTPYGKLIVTLTLEKEDKDFMLRKFEITEEKSQSAFGNDKAVTSFTVTQFHVTNWPELGRPDDSTGVLQLCESVNAVQRSTGNKPVTVVCNDGVGRTGTFICIHAQLERVKTEGVVDVFQFVKSSRISRPNLVSELEYYIFCHHTLADYLDTFDNYANFKDFGVADV